MQVTKEELAATFNALSNGELLKRYKSGTLTPLALEVLTAELRSRGVDIPAPAAAEGDDAEADGGDAPELPELPEGVALVTVARVDNPLKASVLRSCLESEGLFVYLWGEHLGVAHIIFSAATGGMRVQVRSDQLERAREVIAAFERGDYALDEVPDDADDVPPSAR
jgi:hypothetical protein